MDGWSVCRVAIGGEVVRFLGSLLVRLFFEERRVGGEGREVAGGRVELRVLQAIFRVQ